ncbi:MAG: hypothetical protein RL367_2246 [Pseudomonadota bacterium]|jgi:SAM-dependent methyltransferase
MTSASEWQGRVGQSWAAEWQRTDRSFAALNVALVDRIAGMAGQKAQILDIGCGAGATSLALAERLPDARIRGIDLSHDLIAAALERSGRRVVFEQADASCWTSSDFVPDLLVSRHGVMFFDDPVAAMRHFATIIRPGGRMVFSCFRDCSLNNWATEVLALLPQSPPFDPHAPGPFAFADPDHVTAILSAAGWTDVTAEPLDVAYVVGGGDNPVDDAVDFFSHIGPAAVVIRALEGDARDRFLGGLRTMARNHLRDRAVMFIAAVWIWSARCPA